MFGAWDHGSATYYLDTTGFYDSSQANEGEAEIKKKKNILFWRQRYMRCVPGWIHLEV